MDAPEQYCLLLDIPVAHRRSDASAAASTRNKALVSNSETTH